MLMENTYQKNRKGGKLEDAFIGPYTVHKSCGKGIYQLQNEQGKVLKQKINIARLKAYKKRKYDDMDEDDKGDTGKTTVTDSDEKETRKNIDGRTRKKISKMENKLLATHSLTIIIIYF